MRLPITHVPIFPLSRVLFPEGTLRLRVFEARYLDMVSACLKQDVPFGVSMIIEGQEVGRAASFYRIGTLAKIINWAQSSDGVLEIEVLGCQRFRVLDQTVTTKELATANIQLLTDVSSMQVPTGLSALTEMLRNVRAKNQPEHAVADEGRFNDANWVGYRLSEILPIELVMRQRLLEIDNPIERLQLILGLFANR